jgi:hypothetical protein
MERRNVEPAILAFVVRVIFFEPPARSELLDDAIERDGLTDHGWKTAWQRMLGPTVTASQRGLVAFGELLAKNRHLASIQGNL